MSLSDKIEYCENYSPNNQDDIHPALLADVILVKDVREAVKELKLNFCMQNNIAHKVNEQIIDEIFGEELTK